MRTAPPPRPALSFPISGSDPPMRRTLLALLPLALAAFAAHDGAARDGAVTAYRGARLLTAEGAPIDNGVLVVKGGKIAVVGPAAEVKIPEGAAVRDVTGKVIIPGLVDSHSHIGIYPRPGVPANSDGNEMSGPVQPGLRALDAIYPD